MARCGGDGALLDVWEHASAWASVGLQRAVLRSGEPRGEQEEVAALEGLVRRQSALPQCQVAHRLNEPPAGEGSAEDRDG
jgi:hypothetical protein